MPIVTTETDPFTLVHNAIWAALAGIVGGGNQTRFDQGYQQPTKSMDNVQPGDAAAFRLEQGEFVIDFNHCDGQAIQGVLSFPFKMNTADWDVTKLNVVRWRVIQALVTANHSFLMPNLIQHMEVRDGQDTPYPLPKETDK